MSTDKRNAPSDIPIEHAENGTVSATNGVQSGAINDKCMSEGKLTIVVVTLAILTFLGILSETSLNIAYSALMEEFAISADVVQWLTTGYLLLLSVAIPTSPFMVRKFPTKALFVMAIALFSVGTLVGALALNFPMLLAARLIMALGTGVSLPLLTNIILDKAPFHKRGMMLGLVSLVTCAAPAIGPVFGGLVMEFLNWHWIFYAMIPFLVISFVLGAATVPDIRHGEKGYLSVPSLLLVAVGLAGIIVAASFFAQWNGDWRFWSVLIGAIVVLAVFAVLQLRMAHPLVEVRTFAYSGFTLGMVILLMSSGGVLGELLAADSAAARIGAYVDDGRFDFAAGRCDWRGVGSTDRRRVERAFPAEVHRLRFCWRGGDGCGDDAWRLARRSHCRGIRAVHGRFRIRAGARSDACVEPVAVFHERRRFRGDEYHAAARRRHRHGCGIHVDFRILGRQHECRHAAG